MKTEEGNYVICIFTGKICYTEREAGLVINGCKRHVYVGNGRFAKSAHGNSKAIPRRKYYCKDCGFYHLTHLALYDFVMILILRTTPGKMPSTESLKRRTKLAWELRRDYAVFIYFTNCCHSNCSSK